MKYFQLLIAVVAVAVPATPAQCRVRSTTHQEETMRCDQHAGLNEWASRLIRGDGRMYFTGEHTEVSVVLPSGEEGTVRIPVLEDCVRSEPSGACFYGMFDDEYPLMKYTFRDGRVLYEYLQAAPWSSGPVHFLALSEFAPGGLSERGWHSGDIEQEKFFLPESLWTEDQIVNA